MIPSGTIIVEPWDGQSRLPPLLTCCTASRDLPTRSNGLGRTGWKA